MLWEAMYKQNWGSSPGILKVDRCVLQCNYLMRPALERDQVRQEAGLRLILQAVRLRKTGFDSVPADISQNELHKLT